jgi:hypothetical protein
MLDQAMVDAVVDEVEVDMVVLVVQVHKVEMEVGELVGHLEMDLVEVVEHTNLEETDLEEIEVVVVEPEMLITGLVLVVVMVVEEEVVHILDNLLEVVGQVVVEQVKYTAQMEDQIMVITELLILVVEAELKVVVEVQE